MPDSILSDTVRASNRLLLAVPEPLSASEYARPMRVLLCDVGPRDGLQNEAEVLPPATRAELVERLAAAGLPRIEAVSFVRADRVPQMTDAEEVIQRVGRRDGVELSGLVL